MDDMKKRLDDIEKNDDWVDFKLKINYLYKTLFEGNKKSLIEAFSDKNNGTLNYKNSRKKTIDNWLDGNTKKPNGFELSKFKIGDLQLNDEALFTKKTFERWSLLRFKNRVESYLNHQELHSHLQYIYFFDTHHKIEQIGCFDISFPEHNDERVLQLQYENIIYSGILETFNNVTYIRVKNEHDYINFIFKISANTANSVKSFGVAQSVDDFTGKPKSFMVLLTSELLSKEEEAKYAHKLNFSNTLLAEDFSHDCVLKESFFMENFIQKIERLGRDLNHYGINESFSQDIYFDTILKEYLVYMKFLEKAHNHTKYFISNKKESQLFAMNGIYRDEKIDVTISYFLSIENLFLFDNKNPIIEKQIKLIGENKLSLTYLFVVPDNSLLNDKIIQKIEYMENHGIEIKLSSDTSIGYSKLLLIKDTSFALFKFKDLVGDPTHVTRHEKTILKLILAQNLLDQASFSRKEFFKKHNPISGKWYFYTYGSAMENNDCHEIELEITNNQVRGKFSSGEHNGVVFKNKNQILLIFDNSTIKISLYNFNHSLFRVSVIGQDIYINHADLLVFGLLSKKGLTKEDALHLLAKIHMQEEADYRLKVSDGFDRHLAEFKSQQDKIK